MLFLAHCNTQNRDTTALEKEIDVLIYKLYELSYNEVKIIDRDFWLSEQEYKNYKMVKCSVRKDRTVENKYRFENS